MTPTAPNAATPAKPSMKQTISWAFYDWANTGYAMIVLALLFPHLYKDVYAASLTDAEQTAWFGRTLSISSLIVAIIAPFLGSIGELGRLRKRLLLTFCSMGVVATASCYFISKGDYKIASLIFIAGTVSYYCSNIFFDSMLATVSTPKNRHFVSGLGFSFGYAAGFILLGLTFLLTMNYEKFGLESADSASQIMYLIAASWWALFAIPLAINIKEKPKEDRPSTIEMVKQGAKDTWSTLKEVMGIKPVLFFLAAYLFYIDGVNTIIMMAMNYGTTIGFEIGQIYIAFAIVQIFGVPCAILFGWAGGKIGPRKMIFIAIIIYLGVTTFGATIEPTPFTLFGVELSEMFVLAALIGIVQGGIQALSRSYFTTLIPVGREVSFFGFYSMIGKSAAVMGPFLMAEVATRFNNPEDPVYSTRLGMGSVSILFIIGAIFLATAGHYDKRMQRRAAKAVS